MTPERHARIQEIFEAAVELSASERDPFLRQACAGDADLRRQIDRLIGADAAEPPPEMVKVCPVCSRCFDGQVERCPADKVATERALQGTRLIDGKYLIERRLGHGGMGAVYQVRHVGLEKTFALKLILADRAVIDWYRKSFETEARALGRLKHPNIVDVTDYGIDPRQGGVPYLVMEYLEGESLREVLKKRGPLAFDEAAPMLAGIAAGIDFAHQSNIIHADLKPGNLFLANGAIKVVDFGLARFPSSKNETRPVEIDGISADGETVSMVASFAGTPPYMAPELFRADAPSKASDRFAFGVIAYEMLTGELAYGPEGCRSARFHDAPAKPSAHRNLPSELDAPLLALLDPVAERRPRTASAAVDAMRAGWLEALRREWKAREIPRRLAFSAAAAIGVVLLAAGVAATPIASSIEERFDDARFALMPAHPPDPRLLAIAIDDASLASQSHGLRDWDEPMGRMIERLFESGARRVAIDILLPESWASSSEFTQTVLTYADRLALAMESKDGGVIGPECVARPTQDLLGPAWLKLFGFVNVEAGQDRAIRHARAVFPGGSPSFAARALDSPSESTDLFWIDYSARPQEIPLLSWKDAAQAPPDRFRDRIIVIGNTYVGSNDEWPIPSTINAAKIPGVVLQAEIANTLVSNLPVRGIPVWISLVLIALACLGVIATALIYPYQPWISLVLTGAVAAGYVLAAFALSTWLKWMAAVVAPEFAVLVAAGAAWMIESRLTPYPGKDA